MKGLIILKENLGKRNLSEVSGGHIEEVIGKGSYAGQDGIFKGEFIIFREDRPEVGFYRLRYNNEQEREEAYYRAFELEGELYAQ